MSTEDLSLTLPQNCLHMLEVMAQERGTSPLVTLIEIIQQTYLLNHKAEMPHSLEKLQEELFREGGGTVLPKLNPLFMGRRANN
ncbi:MAG: hypothetical protein IAB19_00940 [Proteobacteria bacterium]|uniref:Uncharacterized protein n=1 Tax=Candidatus Avisuccinivibrio stercorigallinarum TaxID=2840704 RepID=A0A9D9D8P4_9GAMM|nr:hypothetical protein [Candidatus Avisuccinivibrio stercorigallinarum]